MLFLVGNGACLVTMQRYFWAIGGEFCVKFSCLQTATKALGFPFPISRSQWIFQFPIWFSMDFQYPIWLSVSSLDPGKHLTVVKNSFSGTKTQENVMESFFPVTLWELVLHDGQLAWYHTRWYCTTRGTSLRTIRPMLTMSVNVNREASFPVFFWLCSHSHLWKKALPC